MGILDLTALELGRKIKAKRDHLSRSSTGCSGTDQENRAGGACLCII